MEMFSRPGRVSLRSVANETHWWGSWIKGNYSPGIMGALGQRASVMARSQGHQGEVAYTVKL